MLDPTKPPTTIAELAQRSFVQHADRPFLGSKGADGAYQFATYGAVARRVAHITCGLAAQGLERGDRVAILSESRPEWVIADLACQMLGVISVPLFSTLPPPQVEYTLRDSGARAIFLSTANQRQKIDEIAANVPELRLVIGMEEAAGAPVADPESALRALSFEALDAAGDAYAAANPGEYETWWIATQPGDVATIIYTSGTTGDPKGAMLMHKNIVTNVESILRAIPLSASQTFLSFLPLAHVYERTAGYYLPTRLGAPLAYCESLFTVDKNMKEVQPNVMFCVPRLQEAMREKILGQAKALPEGQRAKFNDAIALAQKAGAALGQMPGAPSLSLAEKAKYKIYDALVYSKIRERFGGKMWAFVSGGAPLSPEVGALFNGIGVHLLEGYGLTETSPVISFTRPGRVRLGTVGELLDCVEVQIAPDGEILVRGDTVMKGYWNKPAETAEAIDAQGWFHTGDLGALEEKYLRITGRKKDLLVLGNGKKVAPSPIEIKLGDSPYIAQIVLLGDKQKAVSALIVPNWERVKEFAAAQNLPGDEEALIRTPAIQALFRREIDTRSTGLADFEKIRRVALLAQPFTMDAGEITPTLKIKRNVIAAKYGHLVLEATE